MTGLVIFAAIFQALDLLTFAPAVARFGSDGELNPVMRLAYDSGGIFGVAVVKALFLLLIILTVYAIDGASGPSRLGAFVLVFAAVVGLLGALTNIWSLTL